MPGPPKRASGRSVSSAPPSHAYPYPWVRLRSGTSSPLVFQRMVGDVDPHARAGDVVAVYDRKGELFGHGFYHDRSQIALRMVSYGRDAVDEPFFAARVAEAVAWREQLIQPGTDTDACRLVHAEGDSLSGLIAERYADWIAIEVFSLGVFNRLDLFKRLLAERTGVRQFVVRADERIERLEGFRVTPAMSDMPPKTITIHEYGVRFRVDLRAGHKTGFFCDQRDNRLRLASLCRGLRVLDVCCYTGGFGIYAAKAGGAASVTGVDLDEEAIELARSNAKLNEVRIDHVHADGFSYLRQMQTNRQLFDVVVLDPPKFVQSRDDYSDGSHKYVDLNTLGMSVLKPGGLLLTCSCSGLVSAEDFLGMVKASARRCARPLQLVATSGAAPDHPVMANCPESGYLKAIWARLPA